MSEEKTNKKKVVIIEVVGGKAVAVNVPPNVKVEIIDKTDMTKKTFVSARWEPEYDEEEDD